jgi:signal transduction histidine kinase
MCRLVDDILLFASTEDRKNRYVLQPLLVPSILDSIVASTDGLIQSSGFELERKMVPDLPLVIGNLAGISQCMQNLIGNAIKYGGDRKRIVLRVFAASVGHGADQEVRISVADYGIGIDASELARIFDPFYRSPRVHAAQIHGFGLGLALAKRIAESMGGSLSVVSELSVGSTFTLHLNTAKGEDMQMIAAAAGSSQSPRP